MVDLDRVGGLPVVMRELLSHGLLHGDCMTCTGKVPPAHTLDRRTSRRETHSPENHLRSIARIAWYLRNEVVWLCLRQQQTLAENLLGVPTLAELGDQDIVFPVVKPRAVPGRHIIVLNGNLCPGGLL